jgi:plasmid stabilization system protein ParE
MERSLVVKAPGALCDLRAIYARIVLDGGPARAKSIFRTLDETIERLARRPLLGTERVDLPDQLRSFSFRRWTIFYRPLPDGSGVIVLRILDSRRDISALLGKKT